MTDYDALAAELAAVKAECADLIAGKEYQAMQRTLGEVNARLAEAERDAERYRWLRERINFRDQFVRSEDGHGISTKWRAWVHDDYRENPPVSEHIDEYIDAARSADSADEVPK